MTPWLSVDSAKAEFEAFLTAPIGEESNGMTLSVLSGLSRLGLNARDEAAWLSQQPKDVAIARLGQRIASMPCGKWQLADATAIAARLVALLPEQRLDTRARADDRPAESKKRPAAIVLWLVAAGIALSLLFNVPAHFERLLSGDGTPSASSLKAPQAVFPH